MQATACDTLLLSDVHLGSDISRARDALSVLHSCSYRRLILLGDIFSDLNFGRLNGEHWMFLSQIRKLSNRKRKIEVVWVEGNHDHGLSKIMSHLVGIPVYQRYVWEYQGIRHLAIHGHQFDRFVANNALLSRVGELLYARIQKLDHRNKNFSRYLDRLNTQWLRLESKVESGAIAYAKSGHVARIFCGHTHLSAHCERDGVSYYNTGCWVDSRPTYITIGEEGVCIRDYDGAAYHRDPSKKREPQLAPPVNVFEPAGLSALGAYESLRC